MFFLIGFFFLQPILMSTLQTSLESFNWNTVPVFAETSNVSGIFDEQALTTLAKFNLFVGEKAYDYPASGYAEDKLFSLAQELRRRSPKMALIFYYNTNLDLPDYYLHSLMTKHQPTWWLQDDQGNPVWTHQDSGAGARPPFPYNETRVFDHTVADVRHSWVEECLNMTSRTMTDGKNIFTGCFVDRWTRTPKVSNVSKTRMSQWSAARDISTSNLVNRTKEAGIFLISGGAGDLSTDAIAYPGFGHHLTNGITQMQSAAQHNRGFLASMHPSTEEGQDFTNQLAAFLVAASTNHFFGAGSWTCNHTSREGVKWWPEYDKPLGHPLGDAVLNKNILQRNFSKGTNVTFDMKANRGWINWAS